MTMMAMTMSHDLAVVDVTLTHDQTGKVIAAHCLDAGLRYCMGPWSMQIFLPICQHQQDALFDLLSSIRAEYNLPLFGV